MKGLEFPIIGSKNSSSGKKEFDLASLEGRKAYFQDKVGEEIKSIKEYLERGTFMAYMVGKKNSGKGTYSNMMGEIFGKDKIAFVGVGDLVRDIHAGWEEFVKTDEYAALKKNYRGFISFEEAVERLHGRSTSSLLPTEFILSLLKVRLNKYKGKAVFIDGLPRDMDQVSYSLFFRDLANVREDPDMFVLIDIPMAVIDERIKYRMVCPNCRNSRNLKLLVTKDIRYDEETGKFKLICDNPECKEVEMKAKEGDDLGIDPIRPRLEKDEEIIKKVFNLHGMPKVLLRNHVSAAEADKYFDNYELTPEYLLAWDKTKKQVIVKEKPWTIKDDNGVESYSLMAPAVVVSLVKQLADILEVS
jgi:adenylate kinase family enzyme